MVLALKRAGVVSMFLTVHSALLQEKLFFVQLLFMLKKLHEIGPW